MNKSFLSEIARAYGFDVCGDWFSSFPINGETCFRPLSSLEEYLK